MEALTPSSDINIAVRRMTDNDYARMAEFCCGVEVLDHFFRYEVKECVQKRYLAAYCVTNGDEIVGAFTLMNDALIISSQDEKTDFIDDLRFEAPDEVVDFFKRQTTYPAINIGHLGTSIKCQGLGIGMAVIDLVVATFSNYSQAGCQFVTVDALNNNRTIKFYRQNDFSFQTNRDMTSTTRRMYRIL